MDKSSSKWLSSETQIEGMTFPALEKSDFQQAAKAKPFAVFGLQVSQE